MSEMCRPGLDGSLSSVNILVDELKRAREEVRERRCQRGEFNKKGQEATFWKGLMRRKGFIELPLIKWS